METVIKHGDKIELNVNDAKILIAGLHKHVKISGDRNIVYLARPDKKVETEGNFNDLRPADLSENILDLNWDFVV